MSEVRLIDVQQLYNCRTCRYHGRCDFIVTCDHGEMYSPDMSKLETIDPESLRPHGYDTGEERIFKCSECGYGVMDIYQSDERNYPVGEFNYCPHCGVKIVRGK